MLEELEVRHLGPIRAAKLELKSGMTAITGETGAGKSMLLSAIRLISGDAASSARVSPGADAAWAQGVFDVDEQGPAVGFAVQAGAVEEREQSDPDPDEAGRQELFLARSVPASGRSRAVLDGRSVPRGVLADVAGELVTIHGQSDQLRMASAARQREFLDMVAGDETELAEYRKAWGSLQDIDDKLQRISSQESAARQRADYLRDSVEQINAVDPKPGEDEDLKEKRSRIENAAEITRGVGAALSSLDASQVDADSDAIGASDAITRAIAALRTIHSQGAFGEAADRLESLNADLTDIVYSLSDEMGEESSVESLDSINARIHDLDELTRRWGPELSDVIAWRDKAAFEIEDLDASPEKIEALQAERQQRFDDALQAAQKLSKTRLKAAKTLSKTVTAELGNLAMAGAKLDIHVTQRAVCDGAAGSVDVEVPSSAPLDAHGIDDIEFLFTPFPGSAQLPMGKSASGGELSRLMLALELAAAGKRTGTSDMTFIFDEVDAGVGGQAAAELGKRLAQLARTAQVIVVTHLPQVASWADAQFVVCKSGGGKTGNGKNAQNGSQSSVSTVVERVDGEERVHEVARMLAGTESETSLEHARELLQGSTLGK